MKRLSKPWQFVLIISVSAGAAIVFNAINPSGLTIFGGSNIDSDKPLAEVAETQPASNVYEAHSGPFSKSGFPIVSWSEVQHFVSNADAIVVDARPKWSFDAGHIPGAVSLPFSFTTVEPEKLFASQYRRDRHLIIYCGNVDCERSEYLAKKLRDQFQFSHLWLYEAGYDDFLLHQG